jgi:hypothetical protein
VAPEKPVGAPTEDLDQELDIFFKGQEPQGQNAAQAQNAYGQAAKGPILAAIPPKRAENNPINLILGNGDSFVVPEGTNLKPPTTPFPPPDKQGDLGLGADPVATGSLGFGDEFVAPPLSGSTQDGPSAFGAATSQGLDKGLPLREKTPKFFTKNQKTLLLVLSIVAAGLVISTLVMSMGSGPSTEQTTAATAQTGTNPEGQAGDNPAEELASPPDGENAEIKLSFPSDGSSYHYLDNAEAGKILVMTGLVKNDEDKPISHIRLRAKLVDKDNKVQAERQVFAGDYLTEEELKTLSMKEILSRLSLKGGQNGLNVNVTPEKSVPYMFVFDKLPANVGDFTYTIEPVGYSEVTETPPAANPS